MKSLHYILYFLSLFAMLSSNSVSAREENAQAEPVDTTDWKLSLDAALAATQATYSDNWAGGELGSFNWTFTSNSSAQKILSPTFTTSNSLKLSFGQTHTQERQLDGATIWKRPEKNTDLIDFESVMQITLSGAVDPYIALRIESQFYDNSIRAFKRYLTPIKITESGGILRVLSNTPNKFSLKSRLGLALRQIATKVVLDTTLQIADWQTTNDGGIESVTDLKANLDTKTTFTSKLTIYKALFFSKSKIALTDDWKTTDISWEHILSTQFAKVLQVSAYLQLLYDKEIDRKVRIKQTLGLGIAFKLL